jgi:hypothetical protein
MDFMTNDVKEAEEMRIQTVVSSCAAGIRNLNESGWVAVRGPCWQTRSDGSTELGEGPFWGQVRFRSHGNRPDLRSRFSDLSLKNLRSPIVLDGSLYTPRGKLGRKLSEDEGYTAPKSAGLALRASLRRTLGHLDRVTAWLRVAGYVNCAPQFNRDDNGD